MKSAVFLAAAVVLLSACSSLQTVRRPGEQDAGMLLARISHINAGIRDIKGIGRLRLATGATRNSARVALAGTADGALRIDLIGIDGRPLASLAADGDWVSYRGYRPYQFRRRPSSSANLDRILSIPITAREAVWLLSGKVPVEQHQSTDYRPGDGREPDRLELKRFWGDVRQALTLERAGQPTDIAFYGFGGDVRYRAQRSDIRLREGFALPFGLTLTAADGTTVSLAIQRLVPNTGLADDLFILQEAP